MTKEERIEVSQSLLSKDPQCDIIIRAAATIENDGKVIEKLREKVIFQEELIKKLTDRLYKISPDSEYKQESLRWLNQMKLLVNTLTKQKVEDEWIGTGLFYPCDLFSKQENEGRVYSVILNGDHPNAVRTAYFSWKDHQFYSLDGEVFTDVSCWKRRK